MSDRDRCNQNLFIYGEGVMWYGGGGSTYAHPVLEKIEGDFLVEYTGAPFFQKEISRKPLPSWLRTKKQKRKVSTAIHPTTFVIGECPYKTDTEKEEKCYGYRRRSCPYCHYHAFVYPG